VHARPASQPGGASERDADRTADAVVAGTRSVVEFAAGPFVARAPVPADGAALRGAAPARAPVPADGAALRGAAPDLPASPGRALDPAVRHWFEPRLGHDLSNLRIHDDARTAALSRSLGARAFARGRDIYFGAGEYAPATERGRWLIAHEIAHTLQPQQPGRIAFKTLTDLSPATRQKLMISRTAPDLATINTWIKNYFDPKSGISITSPIAAEFGAEITDANQQKGLRSIAIELANLSAVQITPATATEPQQRTNTDPENWPLPPNAILELALDLRPQGGEQAIFRFTRYTNGSADTVLIERTQILTPAPVKGAAVPSKPSTRPAAGGAAASFTGQVRVGNVNITIDPSFGDVRGQAIADAMQLLPDPIRAKVDGVSFELAGSGHGPRGQNGDYQEDKDVVQIWGAMFDPSARRVGEATDTAYQVVHELGHVIDLRPEFKAQRDRAKAEERRKKLEGELRTVETRFINPSDPLGGIDIDKDPRVVKEKQRIQAEITKLNTEIAAANTAMASAKSIAGNELGTNTEALLTDFGKALAADGVKAVPDAKKRNEAVDAANKAAARANAADPSGTQIPIKPHEKALAGGISNYAATDLMEAFAENFAYYALDEAVFKAIRPKTYAFFAKAFPKTVAAKP
jgi:Domain of unknown function (DUF4157)